MQQRNETHVRTGFSSSSSSSPRKPGMMILFFSHHHLLPVAAARLSSCCCCRPVRRFNTPISGSPPLLMEFKFRLGRQKRADVAPRIIWSELLLYFQKNLRCCSSMVWVSSVFIRPYIRVHNEIIYLGDGIVSSFRFSLRFFFFFFFFFSPSCETIRRLIKCDHGGLSCCFNIHFLLCVSARPCSSSPYFSPKMKWRVEGTKKGQKAKGIKSNQRRRFGVEDERESFMYVCTRLPIRQAGCGPAGGELCAAELYETSSHKSRAPFANRSSSLTPSKPFEYPVHHHLKRGGDC